MKNIKAGDVIRLTKESEPVEVSHIEYTEDYIHIIGQTTHTRLQVNSVIPLDEFSECTVLGTDLLFLEEPSKVFLALETIRYKFASLYDPLLAMNTSKVDPLPHQIEAVYGYVLKLPRIRFLIADDPGAGKTIMAGLIIKELKLRNLVSRILIVAPGHLKDQWRRELSERFEEKFAVIDRGLLDAYYGENVWLRENQLITSIDFAKREDILPSLAAAPFHLIIIDEAHKMSAYRYGDKTTKTSRYKLGEILSHGTDHLLFLTATPHKGDPENFRLFLDLLEPGFFATNEMVQESIKNKDNPLFIRRVKEDLKNFDGTPLFLPRHVKTLSFKLKGNSPSEFNLYNSLSKYVNTQYNKALSKDKKRNVAFAIVILQRRFASSTYALLSSLERRKKKLEELLKIPLDKKKNSEDLFDFDTVEDMSEDERWQEEELWETLSVAENREELQKEIETLSNLIMSSRHIIQNEEELKLKELKKALKELSQKFTEEKDKKILIFTESRDTLEYLEKKIIDWGYLVNTIHGGMKLEERVEAEKIFKNETQILVATEAAGEGINLQFCHMMLNYDIPWNPNRLEQRMGRIHRYGQQKEVFVFNLVTEDTREGMVLKKLFDKLEEIKQSLGSDKVFDVLSDILYDKSLSQLLMEASANSRSIQEILSELDITVDEEYISKVKENLGESLATRYIDYTRIKEMSQQAREHRLIPEYTESFFKKAFIKAGGKIKEKQDGFLSIDSIPYDIREIEKVDTFRKSYGRMQKKYPKIIFDKGIAFKNPDAEFISFGHPVFEAVMVWIENSFPDTLLNGATFIDPDGNLDGIILFYIGEITDGNHEVAGKRLFSFYVKDKTVQPVPPSIIWDLAESNKTESETVDLESIKSLVVKTSISELKRYKEYLFGERSRQADIKGKYGIKSLEYLVVKLDQELISLYSRKDAGDNVDLAIRNKEDRKEDYDKARVKLEEQIKREKTLNMTMPHFIGIIRVKPGKSDGMHSDPEIELAGMKVAMEHEIKNGRKPEDVSSENLGFDIRSTDKAGVVRYIEVKARAKVGSVSLTQNEWFKAKRFKDDYYLYVVLNAGQKPDLYIIQNPAESIKAEEKVEVVRYLVSVEEIKGIGKKE